MIYILLLTGVLLNTAAQLLLKHAMNSIGYFVFSWANIIPIGMKVALNPFIIGGLSCYVLSVVVWLLVLSRVEVSFAYPLLSIGYIVNAIIASMWLGETLSMMRVSGIGVIILGVILITRTA